MVVSDAVEFLVARGHNIKDLTDYEIEDNFEKAFKNWQHELVEAAFYAGLTAVEKPKEWKKYCDDIHAAIEGKQGTNDGQDLREMFRSMPQISMIN